MKIFFIRNNEYIDKTTIINNYAFEKRLINQVRKECTDVELFKGTLAAPLVNDHVVIQFQRKISFPRLILMNWYMSKSDAMRLFPFTEADFIPGNNCFREVIKIEGIDEQFVLIEDVCNIYRNRIITANDYHSSFTHEEYELPVEVNICIEPTIMKVKIIYKV